MLSTKCQQIVIKAAVCLIAILATAQGKLIQMHIAWIYGSYVYLYTDMCMMHAHLDSPRLYVAIYMWTTVRSELSKLISEIWLYNNIRIHTQYIVYRYLNPLPAWGCQWWLVFYRKYHHHTNQYTLTQTERLKISIFCHTWVLDSWPH